MSWPEKRFIGGTPDDHYQTIWLEESRVCATREEARSTILEEVVYELVPEDAMDRIRAFMASMDDQQELSYLAGPPDDYVSGSHELLVSSRMVSTWAALPDEVKP